MNIKSDVLFGLQYGDEGKGKCAKYLQENPEWGPHYTHIVRFNGGPNAGHTFYHKGEKLVTHQLPFPYQPQTVALIGSGCVIHPDTFLEEVELFSKVLDTDVSKRIKVAYNAHVITEKHRSDDGKDTAIGTTRRGIGPCYSDKASRKTYLRAETHPAFSEFLCDPVVELNQTGNQILFEGAQGFYLDVDHGDYPYVTSSSVLPSNAFSSGISPRTLSHIWGIAKVYETYVGEKRFTKDCDENDLNIFSKIAEAGNEFGATTGRPRKVNYLHLDNLIKACLVSGTDRIIFNKADVLQMVGTYKLYYNNNLMNFKTFDNFKTFIIGEIQDRLEITKVIFSGNAVTV
jgi:adenylosuccinate synthase